jgi:hypothetical protein
VFEGGRGDGGNSARGIERKRERERERIWDRVIVV